MGGWPLVGRRADVSAIAGALVGDATAALVFGGAPGVGTTRLDRAAVDGLDGARRQTEQSSARGRPARCYGVRSLTCGRDGRRSCLTSSPGAGFTHFRRAAETLSNLVMEVKP